jgi:hypothetical protein
MTESWLTTRSHLTEGRTPVRTLNLVLVVGAAVVAGTGSVVAAADPPPAQTSAETGRTVGYQCASVAKQLTYLFWPKGHAGLPSVINDSRYNLVDLSRPHVSVYRVGRDYLDQDWLVTMQILPSPPAPRDNNVALAAEPHGCHPMHGAPFHYGLAHVKRTRKATALNCTFRTRYGYIGYAGGTLRALPDRIYAHDKYTVFLKAKTTGVPKLTYNTAFCEKIPLPD